MPQVNVKIDTETFLYVFFSTLGQTDLPNRLSVAGENLPFVLHNLQELDKMVETGRLTGNSDPVMIVGAGLSAADAIISTQVAALLKKSMPFKFLFSEPWISHCSCVS